MNKNALINIIDREIVMMIIKQLFIFNSSINLKPWAKVVEDAVANNNINNT